MKNSYAIFRTSAVIFLSLSGCSGEHWHTTGPLTFEPEPGYNWSHPDSPFDFSVQWVPGSTNSQFPNIIAANQRDNWHPAPGYGWVSNESTSLAVRWFPGTSWSAHPHIVASSTEGSWLPEVGYRFVEQGRLEVVWSPGSRNPNFSHIYADTNEGYWRADQGYYFPNPNSLQVTLAPTVPESGQPDIGTGIVSVIAALAANSCSQQHEDDGILNTAGHLACERVRDAAIDSAARAFTGR